LRSVEFSINKKSISRFAYSFWPQISSSFLKLNSCNFARIQLEPIPKYYLHYALLSNKVKSHHQGFPRSPVKINDVKKLFAFNLHLWPLRELKFCMEKAYAITLLLLLCTLLKNEVQSQHMGFSTPQAEKWGQKIVCFLPPLWP